jgi:hypothetical protein
MSETVQVPDNAAEMIAAFLVGARGVTKLRPWTEVAERLVNELILEYWPRVQVQVPCEQCEAFGPLDAFREDEHGNVVNADGDIVETAYYRSNAYQSDPDPASVEVISPAPAPDIHKLLDEHTESGERVAGALRQYVVAKQPSEPNDWTPTVGERVHVIPVGLEGDVAGFDVDGAVFVRYDDYSVFPYRVGSLRPASKDSERAGQ